MAEHVTEWLNAYLDGELPGRKREQVRDHLAKCSDCAAELQALRSLSALLKEVPETKSSINSERFTAQVLLQLPRQQQPAFGPSVSKVAWWLAPAAIISRWVFIQTAFVVSWLVSTALQVGLFGDQVPWLGNLPQYNLLLHTILGLFNGSLESVQPVLGLAESWGQSFLVQILCLSILAGLFWAWLALFWIRRQCMPNQLPNE
jgi:hypothetical protein